VILKRVVAVTSVVLAAASLSRAEQMSATPTAASIATPEVPAPTPTATVAAPARHHVFWDAAFGPAVTDNAYADRSEVGDTGLDVDLQVGLRSRFSSRTFSQLSYGFATTSFRTANVENHLDHAFAGLLRRRLGESLTLELDGAAKLERYPNITVFDNTTFGGQASLKKYLTARTTLTAGMNLEDRSYPDYDLDYHGLGAFASLGHELNRRTYGELAGAWQHNNYSERHVTTSLTAPPGTGPLRREDDWRLAARVSHDLSSTLKLDGAYEFERLSSNGDYVDLGPFQSTDVNTIPNDDRIVGDYYSHRRHEVTLRLRKLVRKGFYVGLLARYRDRAYTGRLAKNADDEFLVPPELRHDHIWQLATTADLPLSHLSKATDAAHLGLRLRLFHETSDSNEALYDYRRNVLTLSLTSWF
jgi:hypothetical protein